MASLSERPTPAGIETTEGDQVFRNPIITFVGAAASSRRIVHQPPSGFENPFQASADRRSMGAGRRSCGRGRRRLSLFPTPAGRFPHRAFSGPEGRHPELLPPERAAFGSLSTRNDQDFFHAPQGPCALIRKVARRRPLGSAVPDLRLTG